MGLLTMTPAAIRKTLAATASVSLLAVGGVLYIVWPRAAASPVGHAFAQTAPSHPATSAPGGTAPNAGDLDVLAERLAQRLRTRDAGDGEGWALLGRSYVALGRSEDALAAFERARRLLGEGDPQLAIDHAAAKAAVAAARGSATGTSSLLGR
jgi:cytochrome c-type biogenesis protein CcmH